ncbi:MAG: TraR/DksA C4-type zinc finger protein [Acidobacteriota bacterium]|mgnify:FL=1
MTEINIDNIKENLLAERDALSTKLNSNDLSVDDTETPDPVDLAVQNYSKNVLLAVSENDSRQLTMIDEALQRIEDEEYGNCLNCGKEIMPKRLQAVPWARFCLSCQELVEKGLIDTDE